MSESVCEFCGLHDISNMDGAVYYACGSSRYDISGVWEQSTGCAEILELRKRIAAAVEAIEAITRNGIDAEDDALIIEEIQCGEWVWWEDLDVVTDILQGNSPEILEGKQ